jgi:UDP-N-acetylmuramate dehydrogenase
MELSKQFPLQNNNSFNVKAFSSLVYFPESLDDLFKLPDLSQTPFYILGEGSNTLFIDQQAPVIVKPNFTGIKITDKSDHYSVSIGAGENWHDLVCYCLSKGMYGLENLALIPGSVGAAPVQNIGAYGVEFSDFCDQIKWFEFKSKTVKTLKKNDCEFAYRNSIFKERLYNRGIIIEVRLNFPKEWKANLSYQGLNQLPNNVTALEIMAMVIKLRESKLPDPAKLPNAGSFFKNPIVELTKLHLLQKEYPTLPFYMQPNGTAKLAAGWLIEKTGLKGFRNKGVGVHEHQALVLVNYESDDGKDIVKLAKYVQQQVFTMFDIRISPEVRMLTNQGERNFDELALEYK